MVPETLEAWLRPFGLTDDFSGRADFTYQDEITLSVELSDDGEAVFLSAGVARLPDPDDADMLRTLLMQAHLGTGTGGFALSLDESGETVVVWTSWPASALDAEGFASLLSVFLDAASAVRSGVLSDQNDGDDRDDTDPDPRRSMAIQV